MASVTYANPGDVVADVRAAAERLRRWHRCSCCGDWIEAAPAHALGERYRITHRLAGGLLCGFYLVPAEAPREVRALWDEMDEGRRR